MATPSQTSGTKDSYASTSGTKDDNEIDGKKKQHAEILDSKRPECQPTQSYNILPLFLRSNKPPAIMELPEINAALNALRRGVENLRRFLPSNEKEWTKSVNDIFDWLSVIFGFQNDNVANQREHLILLLANIDLRAKSAAHGDDSNNELGKGTVKNLMDRIFENYESWCDYVGDQSLIKDPSDEQQRKLIYIALYLLIWGEASNVRFMPECVCYIFHGMSHELNTKYLSEEGSNHFKRLQGQSSARVKEECFLTEVITPIYEVLADEAKRGKKGKASHSNWRNYDDLNEYFWSNSCFKLGWPMDRTADFFRHHDEEQPRNQGPNQDEAGSGDKTRKMNFVEFRTILHLYRSFDRMWIFFILALQAMIIIAWSDLRPLAVLSDKDFLRRVIMSILATYAGLHFLIVILDVILAWNALKNMKRTLCKLVFAAAGVLGFALSYFLGYNVLIGNRFTIYICAVVSYLSPNIADAIFFFFPMLESSYKSFITRSMSWYHQPKLYIGGGIAENMVSKLMYLLFWIMLLTAKLLFSYYVEIYPLVRSTKLIMDMPIHNQMWKLSFGKNGKISIVSTIWAPIILVYFTDVQIWYAIFSSIWGWIIGAFRHLGEIRTSEMMRSRIESVLKAFNSHLAPEGAQCKTDKSIRTSEMMRSRFESVLNAFNSHHAPEGAKCKTDKSIKIFTMLRSRFEFVLKAFGYCLMLKRVECKANNLVKSKNLPTANKVQNEEPNDINDNDNIVERKSLLDAKAVLSQDESSERPDSAYFSAFWNDFIKSMRKEDLISNRERDLLVFPNLSSHVSVIQWPPFLLATKIPIAIQMAEDFKGSDDSDLIKKVKSDQFMYSAVIECYETLKDIMINVWKKEKDKKFVRKICDLVEKSIQENTFVKNFSGLASLREELEALLSPLQSGNVNDKSKNKIISFLQYIKKNCTDKENVKEDAIRNSATIDTSFTTGDLHSGQSFEEKVRRLCLLLSLEDPTIEVPSIRDARRRIKFFANSLFMKMPKAPKVQDMMSFSVLTPYFKEDVLYSNEELYEENEDGISVLFYLKKIYANEWNNLSERIEDEKLCNSESGKDEMIRHWASNRGQTLCRTVRGMMYYQQALDLQCSQECGGGNATLGSSQGDQSNCLERARASIKFTFVVSCQIYGNQKKSKNSRDKGCYNSILKLMLTYPSLRVAYIDESEETVGEQPEKCYYSVLVKGGHKNDEVIYRIKLPGPPTEIGEGKPENQNHAIIFTRGEAVQTIDMNQDNYFEEAFKMRNVLEEFRETPDRQRRPTILGLREHIFTGSVSSLALFMSSQETSFVTIGQRILADPLRVRFHYGHPDIFDRIFHMTRGGISKASKVINLSEDIFAGFNSTLRGGLITHHEYVQVGKGRDLGMNQISVFEAKVASGNGEQTLSRDVYRLGRCFDFFRMLSFYFTTVGFYFNSMLTVLTVYVFLYGRLYLVLSGVERQILQNSSINHSKAIEKALATQSVFQLGLLMVLPLVMEAHLERGFGTALGDLVIMHLQLAPVFFTFQLGTKAHYYGTTILHGGSKYRATGRGFVVSHAKFAENYRMYSRSHFVKGLEIVILLIVNEVYGSNPYPFITISMWFLPLSWLFAPFLFNPSGFDWQKTVRDWTDWKRWMRKPGGIGISPEKSWESWWDEENEHLRYTSSWGTLIEITLALRFFVYQYGIVYHLHIVQVNHGQSIWVYLISLAIFVLFLGLLMMASKFGQKLMDHPCAFRILKAIVFLVLTSAMIVLLVVNVLTISDLFAAIIAFMLSGWGLILIAQACRVWLKRIELWDHLMKELARAYEYIMGLIIFMPIAILSWFPFVSEFQTRILFNQEFSRGLQISMILAGGKDSDKNE